MRRAGAQPRAAPWAVDLAPTDNHRDDIRGVTMHRNRNGEVSLTVPARHIRHIERFWRRRCALDLWRLGIFPDIKEVSEAEAMRHAMLKKLRMHERAEGTTVLVAGDGRTPRLGALLAYTTSWTAISIDPVTRDEWPESRRLHVIAKRVEDTTPEELRELCPDDTRRVVVAAPHSHAQMDDCVQLAREAFPQARIDAVAMPCCVRQSVSDRASCEQRYEDLGVWSGKPVIQIWRHLEHKGQTMRTRDA